MTKDGVLIARDHVVESLRDALTRGRDGLAQFPAALKRVLEEELWRERRIARTGAVVKFDRFSEFVKTPPLEGLGADVGQLKALAKGDAKLLDLLDLALKTQHGGDRRSSEINLNNIKVDTWPEGTSAQQAIRRLRKDRPDLLERVKAGELSPHAAAIEAGFRKRTRSVPIDSPGSAIRALLRVFSRSELEAALSEAEA